MKCSSVDLFFIARDSETSKMLMSGLAEFSIEASKNAEFVALMAEGLRSAQRRFPELGRKLKARTWIEDSKDFFLLERRQGSTSQRREALERFLKKGLAETDKLFRQLLFYDEGEQKYFLAQHMHHALCDGVSFGLVFDHQTRVAFGDSKPPEIFTGSPRVRKHPRPQRKNPHRFSQPCDSFWVEHKVASTERLVMLWDQPRSLVDDWLATKGTIKPLDFFSCLLMDASAAWNESHGHGAKRIGLFIPNNNRVEALQGFGHGTSRIRLYRQYLESLSPAERMGSVRQQIQWSRRHGEWDMPTYDFLTKLPWATTKWLLNWASDSPLFDLGTLLFTFLPSFSEQHLDTLVPALERVYGLTAVTSRTPVSISITGLSQNYHWSINYDSGRISEKKMAEFLALLQKISDSYLQT